MKKTDDVIDFIITWVDGSDEEWIKSKNESENRVGRKSSSNRYRNWDNLQYLFRGIEKFAPWVNKVHFVTCGHLPKWLNVNHPKINIIRHDDYMPHEYLPTFSSHPIELNFHRIKELSEKFVYFNDDTFLLNHVKKTDFFKNNLPCAACGFELINPAYDKTFFNILGNNTRTINKYYKGKDIITNHFFKLFNIKYDLTYIKTLLLLPWCRETITGFINPHLPNAYLKSTWDIVWEKEFELLNETSKHIFRDENDVSQDIFRYWQYASGKFEPINMKKLGSCFSIYDQRGEYDDIIKKQKTKLICFNDDFELDDETLFCQLKNNIINDFNSILGTKCSYEL